LANGTLDEVNGIKSYVSVLKRRNLCSLWLSQVLSAIGDQLHSLAVLWISVQIGGPKAGFVAAAGTTAGVAVGLLAGVYADRWNRRVAMVAVDIIRAVAVLILAAAAQAGSLQLWELALVAVVVASLGSLFNPCMFASLPALVPQPEMLRAITALMIMTFRIARLIGPGIAGVVLAYFPISTFFVIDSATYVVSALAIWSLGANYVWRPEKISTNTGVRAIVDELRMSGKLVLQSPQLSLCLGMNLMEAGLWCSIYLVGFPLMVKQAAFGASAANVSAYATMVCAYGFGNVLSLLAVGTKELHRRAGFFSGLGLAIMGLGFLLVSFTHNLVLACAAAAFAASGGPIADMATTTLVQQCPDEHRGKLNSFRGFVGGLGAAIGLATAPYFFATLSSTTGIAVCAGGIFAIGCFGAIFGPAMDKRSAKPGADKETNETDEVGGMTENTEVISTSEIHF
jgi:MFS family permease